MSDDRLRAHLVALLTWERAHASFESAVAGLPPGSRGEVPPGAPHSPWQLVEHLRLSQRDILQYCTDADYEEPAWPDAYWPPAAAPPGPEAWDESVAAFLHDRDELVRLARDPGVDLFAPVPGGPASSHEELLIVADHNAYHVGQLVLVRRLLQAWPGG